jgi:hypothetical protein
MIKTSLRPDIQSCYSPLVMLARRHDIVALVRDSNLFRVIYAHKFTLDEVQELQKLDTVVIILRGKTTKSLLTDAQREDLIVHIREANANLN